MVRVLLIVLLAGCAGNAQGPGTTTPLTGSADSVPDSLWDEGTFIVVDKERVEPGEEKFRIYRTDSGYRFAISWNRSIPTGEPADGSVTLETDDRFSPTSGDDVMNLHAATGVEVTKSSIRRDPDGRLATVSIEANGKREVNQSAKTNDWFIGGRLTTLLTVICQASPDFSAPVVYPDKQTSLDAAQPLPIEGTTRSVTVRVLTYLESKNRVVAACEDGKLVGEVTRGVTIVRTGDLALARTLEKWFR